MNRIGALLLLIGFLFPVAPCTAEEYTVWPTLETNTTGYTDYALKNDGEVLVYGGASTGTTRMETGYFKFDTSVIPDTSSACHIAFHFYVNEAFWPYWSVTPVSLDPVPIGSTAAMLWDDAQAEKTCGYYNYQMESAGYAPGWKMLGLGGTANADMTANLANDWFAFGAASRDFSTTYYLEIDGHDGPNVPYLVVDDEPPHWPDCFGAIDIPGTPGLYTYTGDNIATDGDLDCSAPCVNGLQHPGNDVQYMITPPSGCEICVTLNQSVMTWNGGVYMVTDCYDVNGTCVAGASGWLAGGLDETFCYSDSTATETYYIIVDGRSSSDMGTYQLDISVGCLDSPSDLTCTDTPLGVDLAWTNNDAYDQIEIFIDGIRETTVPGADTGVFVTPNIGYHCFYVCGVVGADSNCSDPCCLIYGYNMVEVLWDFEADDGGFVVDGTGGWQWGDPTYGPGAGIAEGNVWATDLDDDYVNNACWLLDSGIISIGSAGLFLAIDHCYDIESGWDGGVVWFTTDDYWYYTFEPLDGADDVITGSAGCPWVAGRDGFTGNSGGWVTDVWDFTDPMWQNQTVKLRFAFGADSSIIAPGWMIDNVKIYWHHTPYIIDCDYTVTPLSGTVPFPTVHRITLHNLGVGGVAWTRRIAARIALTIGNGSHYNPWRAGYTNVAPSSMFTTQFYVTLPALASVIGSNTFVLSSMDVTPAPYNQPPYPPAGNTCTRTRTVEASAP